MTSVPDFRNLMACVAVSQRLVSLILVESADRSPCHRDQSGL